MARAGFETVVAPLFVGVTFDRRKGGFAERTDQSGMRPIIVRTTKQEDRRRPRIRRLLPVAGDEPSLFFCIGCQVAPESRLRLRTRSMSPASLALFFLPSQKDR